MNARYRSRRLTLCVVVPSGRVPPIGVSTMCLPALVANDSVPVGWPVSVTTCSASSRASADSPFTATVRYAPICSAAASW
ncbi:hypothetical protein F3087_20315 [Nocardia colli]|uniref:Uncharacterized protein n=1 Tax=Nocardia colli TaxID=2545717 RepID=A0A5N0EG81_9NOCA|nr:hypothetical protein [Nocardia colli]KAA8887244.1 hypothetical protein F3087_20315 [Nocardia colli]